MKNFKWWVLGSVALIVAFLLAGLLRYQYFGAVERVDRFTGKVEVYNGERWVR